VGCQVCKELIISVKLTLELVFVQDLDHWLAGLIYMASGWSGDGCVQDCSLGWLLGSQQVDLLLVWLKW